MFNNSNAHVNMAIKICCFELKLCVKYESKVSKANSIRYKIFTLTKNWVQFTYKVNHDESATSTFYLATKIN